MNNFEQMAFPERTKNRIEIQPEWLDMPLVAWGGYDNITHPVVLKPHTHDGYEITYLTSGEVTWQLENGTSLLLKGGHVAVTKPDETHWGEWEIVRPCKIHWFVFRVRHKDLFHNTPFTAPELRSLFSRLDSLGDSVAPASKNLADVFERMRVLLASHLKRPLTINIPLMRSLLSQILVETTLSLHANTPDRSSQSIECACAYMENHLTEPISMSTVARTAGFTNTRFFITFKKIKGLTPADHLQRLRCEKACEALKRPGKSITDIAFDHGFSSSQYFATCFKKYMGQTPKEFGKKFRLSGTSRASRSGANDWKKRQ